MRLEDVDLPRVVAGASLQILNSLEDFGLHWDGPVVYQSSRAEAYREALDQLQQKNLIYGCVCTRKKLAATTRRGLTGELFYPGTCRHNAVLFQPGRAGRVIVPPKNLVFKDVIQGEVSQNLHEQSGDFVLQRADGIFSYHLAVVVDDAWQGVSEVVRGSDILHSTARHLFLQGVLGLRKPLYAHLPVVTNALGEKLSKQTKAQALHKMQAPGLLFAALQFLGQNPPHELSSHSPQDILQWGLEHWQIAKVSGVLSSVCSNI